MVQYIILCNRVDLEALHTAGRAVGASGRASGQFYYSIIMLYYTVSVYIML